MRALFAVIVLFVPVVGCGSDEDKPTSVVEIVCGEGTRLVGVECVVEDVDPNVDPDPDPDTGDEADTAAEADTADDADTAAEADTGDEADTGSDTGTPTDPDLVDDDGDGFTEFEGDCDDADATIGPTADEVCDDIDNDCNGWTDDFDPGLADGVEWYADFDGDGFGSAHFVETACAAPSGYVALAEDCDDLDADIHPEAVEVCDGADNDCDGEVDGEASTDQITWYADGDLDGYGDADSSITGCEAPAAHVDNSEDCDDGNGDVHPDAVEVCDEADNDCDGEVDGEASTDQSTWYADGDSDGYGDPGSSISACEAPADHVDNSEDCDDGNGDVHPDAVEICDEADNDCNGWTDDGDVGLADGVEWYADFDGDGFGGAHFVETACVAPSGYVAVAVAEDCDDLNAAIHPDAVEVCDGADNDCDGEADGELATDQSTWFADADSDGYGDLLTEVLACFAPTGHVDNSEDCDDSADTRSPSALELCDAVDNDCDGEIDEADAVDAPSWYVDSDGDGVGWAAISVEACTIPDGYAPESGDCNDLNSAIHPEADEVCDGVDNNCDGEADEGLDITWYADGDGDGYGNPDVHAESCAVPPGFVSNDLDCDDSEASTNPDGVEVCDGVDNNCDGEADEGLDITWYDDNDADGFGNPDVTAESCAGPAGFVENDSDCNDSDASIHPDADEVCDHLDNNCDGEIDEDSALDVVTWYRDADDDGYGDAGIISAACDAPEGYLSDGTDCDDADASVNPGTEEFCDELDNDCDGTVDEGLDGLGAECAAVSCLELYEGDSAVPTGLYWLDPDGLGAFETFCIMDEAGAGAGWTLAIRGTLDGSYDGSFGKDITDGKGFMQSFESVLMTDIMVVPGEYDLFASDPAAPEHYAVYNGIGDETRTLQEEIEDCCTGSSDVDWGIAPPHGMSYSSDSLDTSGGEMSGLSLRMSQFAGPNDGMFFVIGDSGVTHTRRVDGGSMGVQLGFGLGFHAWEDWTTWSGWDTTCGESGYRDPASSDPSHSCTPEGAIFVR